MPNVILAVDLKLVDTPQPVDAPEGALSLGVAGRQLLLLADPARANKTRHVQAFVPGDEVPPGAVYHGHSVHGEVTLCWFAVKV